MSDQIRFSPVISTMFSYFDYYTGNPVLVSSEGTRDIFHVQSKSNYCLLTDIILFQLLTAGETSCNYLLFQIFGGLHDDMLAVDGWCIEL